MECRHGVMRSQPCEVCEAAAVRATIAQEDECRRVQRHDRDRFQSLTEQVNSLRQQIESLKGELAHARHQLSLVVRVQSPVVARVRTTGQRTNHHRVQSVHLRPLTCVRVNRDVDRERTDRRP